MRYNRVNNIVGWAVCAIACIVYMLTMERTASFWDCGEFISCCFKLQVPHPPGAPLFVLTGRLFIILFGDHPATAALAVNCMSAVLSGLTILFLFWSITCFARKLVTNGKEPVNHQQLFTIMSAGAVGALAYTFSDSFWFSAVEGEVYAFSSFFTALVFWSVLKWEQLANRNGADRWLVFIFFMVGLSIGVHLLNLLTIPAIVMVYYFKRYRVTTRGTLLAFLTGCLITGFIQKVIIQYTIEGAGWFDVHFVNDLGLPFFTGFACFFVLLGMLLIWGLQVAARKNYYYLRLGIWSTVFLLLGYSTYLTTMIRSNSNPAIDMFNVDNPISLAGYLSRDQYNDWPILYGPDYTDAAPYAKNEDLYVKTKNKYEVAGKKIRPDWSNTPSSHLFPRMWDSNNDRQQKDCYFNFTGLQEDDAPTMADNAKYFVKYQAGWMYMRYFMWNFAGRQNDLQGFGNPRDSNWISGIPVVDKVLYGDQSKLPETAHTSNKAYNRLYMLPLFLGLAGLLFQFKRNRKDFLVNALLFFFTGLAIVVYLNQSGYQPRERDYAYVGSYYAFAIWIGLGVIWVKEMLEKRISAPIAGYAATALCLLLVPLLMAHEEWDDHDRSSKTLARDFAKNYLESCPPNAILFSFEDNDTYPLWYAQEVEGIRPDVRVIVNTISGEDWFMNQLRHKINNSAPLDIIFSPEQIEGDRRQVIYYSGMPGFDQNKYYDLYSTLKNIAASDDPKYTVLSQEGNTYNILPVRKFSVPVDRRKLIDNGTVYPSDQVETALQLDMSGKNYFLRSDMVILSAIATSHWDRPICFTSTFGLRDLGLDKYLRLQGQTYQLVPIKNQSGNISIDEDRAYNNIMHAFSYGHAGKKPVYYDEENRRRLNLVRLAHAQVAIGLAEKGKRQEARELLEHFDQNVSAADFPYGMTTNRGNQHDGIAAQFLYACYLSGDKSLAQKVSHSLQKDLRQQMEYYRFLGDTRYNDDELAENAYGLLQNKGGNLSDEQSSFTADIVSAYQLLRQTEAWNKEFGSAAN